MTPHQNNALGNSSPVFSTKLESSYYQKVGDISVATVNDSMEKTGDISMATVDNSMKEIGNDVEVNLYNDVENNGEEKDVVSVEEDRRGNVSSEDVSSEEEDELEEDSIYHVSSDKEKETSCKESENEGDSSDGGTSTKSHDVSLNKVVLSQQISKIIIMFNFIKLLY